MIGLLHLKILLKSAITGNPDRTENDDNDICTYRLHLIYFYTITIFLETTAFYNPKNLQ